jgi:hypothetical protein
MTFQAVPFSYHLLPKSSPTGVRIPSLGWSWTRGERCSEGQVGPGLGTREPLNQALGMARAWPLPQSR